MGARPRRVMFSGATSNCIRLRELDTDMNFELCQEFDVELDVDLEHEVDLHLDLELDVESGVDLRRPSK